MQIPGPLAAHDRHVGVSTRLEEPGVAIVGQRSHTVPGTLATVEGGRNLASMCVEVRANEMKVADLAPKPTYKGTCKERWHVIITALGSPHPGAFSLQRGQNRGLASYSCELAAQL